MKRTLKKGICIATAAMMVAGMTSVTALADDTKASGKINFYYWDADQTNEVNKVIELFNEQNPDIEVVATQIPSGEYWTKTADISSDRNRTGCFWMNRNIPDYINADPVMGISQTESRAMAWI